LALYRQDETVAASVSIAVAGREPAQGTGLSRSETNWLLIGLGLATGMEFYTFDSVNLVLPDLTGTLAASTDEATWILTVYSSALFLGVPISIWLAGHVGYKRFLITTILLFAIASLGCAASPNLVTMLVARVIQGFAGAGLVVWWRASIYLLLPKPQRSPSLMRVSTMLYLSSAAGLLASGYITDHDNWRLIFLPDLVYAAVAIWLLLRHFPTVAVQRTERLAATDGPGIILIAIALVSLQIILSRGEIDDWFGSSHIRTLSWISASAFIAFVLWQSSTRNPSPLLRLDLLRDRNVMSSALLGVFTGMILSGSLFVLPEFLRDAAGQTLSATQTGQVIAVYALTAAAVRPLMVGVIARLGQRKTICLALVMLILSMVLFSRFLTTGTPTSYFYLPLILYALCLSALLPAVGSGTVARIEQQKLLDGVSLYMTFRQFGASLGVAALNILVERRETLHSSRLYDHLTAANSLVTNWLSTAASVLSLRGGYSPVEGQHAAIKMLAQAGARQALTLAYADAFLFMAAIGTCALCLVPIMAPSPVASGK
jgi:MFS transporter, DHA2 family, multidrug resistance protein